MQLTAQEDIEATLDQVYAELSNFPAIERQALRRGIEVQRTDSIEGIGPGNSWDVKFGFRGKKRAANILLKTLIPQEKMEFTAKTGGLETFSKLDFVALSRGRTRLQVTSDFSANTLSARLMLQSFKLAKGGIDKRFRTRMGAFAQELEKKLKSQA